MIISEICPLRGVDRNLDLGCRIRGDCRETGLRFTGRRTKVAYLRGLKFLHVGRGLSLLNACSFRSLLSFQERLLLLSQACLGLLGPGGTFILVSRLIFRLLLLNVLDGQGFDAFALHSGSFGTRSLDHGSNIRGILDGHFLNGSGMDACFPKTSFSFQGSPFSLTDQSFGLVQLSLGLSFLLGKLLR
jgi:hypothetical protein